MEEYTLIFFIVLTTQLKHAGIADSHHVSVGGHRVDFPNKKNVRLSVVNGQSVYLLLHSVRNSSRVLGSSRNTPSIVEVTVLLLIFWTPRMTMHM